MDLPQIGLVHGNFDLRASIDEYLGPIEFAGQRVLEIGPASGFLTFAMEQRGAELVSVELPEDIPWDYVPYYHPLLDEWRNQVPEDAPNHFLINVTPEQVDELSAMLGEVTERVGELYPMVRGRVTAVNGVDADSLVRRFGPLPAERAIHLMRQVCHSLSEAESRGLVHRDIKPANIFLCRYGEDHDFVKVLDFGIVKTSRDTETGDTVLTGKHSVHGTPAYMAPEQALGNPDVDGRADIYSLGCVAYWLLTGTTVFTAETPTGLLMHHIQSPPTPPSQRSEVPVPGGFEAVVMACLAKDPADRPGTARELDQRLAALESADAWTRERCREWWERHLPAPVPAPA